MTTANVLCELCQGDGGELLFQGRHYRVVLVEDAAYPGFCRVIWNGHVKEMTDLSAAERAALMDGVWAVEAAVREIMQPEKINLASLGNMTPHVHWHVIPRYLDDAHFPSPVWAAPRRTDTVESLTPRQALLPALRLALQRHLQALS